MLRVIVSFGREEYEHRRFREQGEIAVDERVKLTVQPEPVHARRADEHRAGISIVFGFGAWHRGAGEDAGRGLDHPDDLHRVDLPAPRADQRTVGSLHEQFVQFNASFQLLDVEPEVKEAPNAIEIARARGDVTIDDLSFSYSGRSDTLRDISLEAPAGETVAMVGPTGAGKTTLMSLLIRFYDPAQGRILIDGIDIRDLKLSSLRDQISVVLQEPLLFSGTIAENIRYGKLDATNDEVAEAATAANAHDFIYRLPDGYETELGERGAQLSGGERQRICVARAFIKDAPILVLDEPTSSIDSKTEGVILDALDELMVGRTSFMVAHRLSTIRHADQILVVHQGRIVERGRHEELLEVRGVYRQLHEAQSRPRRRRGAGERGRSATALLGDGNGDGSARPGEAETVSWREITTPSPAGAEEAPGMGDRVAAKHAAGEHLPLVVRSNGGADRLYYWVICSECDLRLGPFADHDEAQGACNRLQDAAVARMKASAAMSALERFREARR